MTEKFAIDDESAPIPNPWRDGSGYLADRIINGEAIDEDDRFALYEILHSYGTLLLCTNKRALEIRRAYRKHLKENS